MPADAKSNLITRNGLFVTLGSAGLPSRLRNAAQTWVVVQDQITCVEGHTLEVSTVTGNE